jgi:hypothetical protein
VYLSAFDVVSFRISIGGVIVGNVCALHGYLLPGRAKRDVVNWQP